MGSTDIRECLLEDKNICRPSVTVADIPETSQAQSRLAAMAILSQLLFFLPKRWTGIGMPVECFFCSTGSNTHIFFSDQIVHAQPIVM